MSRVLGTTLLLAGLSLALSPELLAHDPLAQSFQGPVEASAHQSEGSSTVFVTEPWEDNDEEDEIIPIPRKKPSEDLRGSRFGFCAGLDLSCFIGGVKVGYSWEHWALLVQLPFFDVEGALYFRTFESSGGVLSRPFVSADWNVLAFLIDPPISFNFGVGVDFVGKSRRLILRPRIGLGPVMFDDFIPVASLSVLFVR